MKTKITYLIIFLFFMTIIEYTFAQTGWGFRNPLPQNNIYKIDFLNINSGFGVCSAGLVIRTTNGGNTWTFLRSLTGKNLYSIYFFDINTGYAAGDSGIILYTSNSGTNWTARTTGLTETFRSIYFVNTSTGFICGSNGKLLKSTNGGVNWNIQTIGSGELNEINFLNLTTGYIAGSAGLFAKTTNTGLNWATYTADSSTMRSVMFTGPDTGFMAGSRGIFQTVNGGVNWTNIYNLYYNRDMYRLKFLNSATGYCIGKDNPILKTTNSGLNWGMVITSVFTPYTFYDICLIGNTGYVSGTDGYILKDPGNGQWATIGGTRHNVSSIALVSADNITASADNQTLFSTDSGLNWRVDTYGSNNFFEPNYILFKKVFFSGLNGWRISRSSGGGTNVYSESISRTTNGGVSWNAPGGWYGGWFTDINDVDAVGNIAVIAGRNVGQGGYIMKSVSGSNWVSVYTNSADTYFMVSFADTSTGIVEGASGAGYCIVRTTDGGASWTRYQLPSGYYGFIQLLTPDQGLMISNTGTIYRSSNGGIDWFIQSSITSGIRAYRFVNPSRGWAVGSNGLILYSSDGGYNWSPQQSNTTVNLNSVSFTDELNGVIGGDSGTVLKTTNGGITYIITVDPVIPRKSSLEQNYPNPFNPTSKIRFEISKLSEVTLVIYDILGREITTLENEKLNPGIYEITWDGTNYPSGVYFYKLITADFTETRKMVLIK